MLRTYERIVMPYCVNHLLDELHLLVDRYYRNISPNKATIYMNSVTYYELREQVKATHKIYANFDIEYDPIHRNYGTFYNIPIQIDNTMEPLMFRLREEDNYMANDLRITGDLYMNSFRGGFTKVLPLLELPTRYIINDGAVILFWDDGTKTIVKRSEDDNFDPVKGFLWAYFQKHSGLSKTKANKYLRDLDYDYDKYKLIRF